MTLLASVVGVSRRVASTSARGAKVRALASFLSELSAGEIIPAVHFLSGEIRQGRIGIGYSAVQAAAVEPSSHASLSIQDLDECLTELAEVRGSGSGERRTQILRSLLARGTEEEQSFLRRLVLGELRQGALAGIMVEAIAAAAKLPVASVRGAAMFANSLGAVARAALVAGAAGLHQFRLQLFSPVVPMLAQTAGDTEEALRILGGEAAFEWKMDGARIQVHKLGADVRVYTRGLNEVTQAVPEIVAQAREFTSSALVLDGEAIALDDAGRPHPFQVTMRRFGRKLDVDLARARLPIRAFYFDCLRLEEESLVSRPGRERSLALAAAVPQASQIPRLVTASAAEAAAFYDASLAAGHEGLMAKSLDAAYEAGNRGAHWLKIKRAHTLDLVVLAAEWGHGRRTGKLSNLHLGALEPATQEYVMLGKTFKGLTDALLEWQTKELLAREIRRDTWTVYVRPELVVEIAFSDLQASTRYPGGLALRLARVKRYRDDKPAKDADTMDMVRRIFSAESTKTSA